MLFLITLSNESKLDFIEADAYFLAISKDLSSKFRLDLSEAIERLSKDPNPFQKRYRNIKIAFTKVFPFDIHYLVEGNTVFIQRILHQKQLYK